MAARASSLHSAQTTVLQVGGATPAQALSLLRGKLQGGGAGAASHWRQQALLAGILGSCPKTKASLHSGLMHWLEYIDIVHGPRCSVAAAFPAQVSDIVGWSNTFRCLGTFGNYLGFLRSASCALGFESPPVGHPAIRRAMSAIAKRQVHTARSFFPCGAALARQFVPFSGPSASSAAPCSGTW